MLGKTRDFVRYFNGLVGGASKAARKANPTAEQIAKRQRRQGGAQEMSGPVAATGDAAARSDSPPSTSATTVLPPRPTLNKMYRAVCRHPPPLGTQVQWCTVENRIDGLPEHTLMQGSEFPGSMVCELEVLEVGALQ